MGWHDPNTLTCLHCCQEYNLSMLRINDNVPDDLVTKETEEYLVDDGPSDSD
jgi:hypothetical protein